LNEYDYNGRILRVCDAKSSGGDLKSTKILGAGESDTIKLNDINTDIDEELLRKKFGKVGKIRRVFNPEGKNFAYVS